MLRYPVHALTKWHNGCVFIILTNCNTQPPPIGSVCWWRLWKSWSLRQPPERSLTTEYFVQESLVACGVGSERRRRISWIAERPYEIALFEVERRYMAPNGAGQFDNPRRPGGICRKLRREDSISTARQPIGSGAGRQPHSSVLNLILLIGSISSLCRCTPLTTSSLRPDC